MAALSERVLEIVETAMKNVPYKSEFARKYYRQGLEEGVEDGLRRAVVRVARAKLHNLTPEQESVLQSLHGSAAEDALEAIADANGEAAVAAVIAALATPAES